MAKVIRSNIVLIGPKTSINFKIDFADQFFGFCKKSTSTLSHGIANCEKSKIIFKSKI